MYCYAERSTGAVIDPRGWVYRCACTNFGEAERVGFLKQDGQIEYSDLFFHTWEKLVALEPPECLNCVFLPVCNFGCPKNREQLGSHRNCKQFYRSLIETQLTNGLVETEASFLSS